MTETYLGRQAASSWASQPLPLLERGSRKTDIRRRRTDNVLPNRSAALLHNWIIRKSFGISLQWQLQPAAAHCVASSDKL